jgi:multidrug efflux pump subunit AcrA (membrane-fusion protein)
MSPRAGKAALALGGMLLLAGCGGVQALTPAPGNALPVRPVTAPLQPNAQDLLTTSPTTRAARSDELLIRSQPRRDDRFDLPPH